LTKEQDDRQKGCRSERTGSRRRKERKREEGMKDGLETRMEICKLDWKALVGSKRWMVEGLMWEGLRVEKAVVKDGG
jgi:hypothetical protein